MKSTGKEGIVAFATGRIGSSVKRTCQKASRMALLTLNGAEVWEGTDRGADARLLRAARKRTGRIPSRSWPGRSLRAQLLYR